MRQDVPSISLEGEIYPPSDNARLMSNVMFYARLVLMGLILGGRDVMRTFGVEQPPNWLLWMFENKVRVLFKNFLFS